MLVSNARVFTPHSLPSLTIAWASSRAFSSVGIKAAAPNFTSNTNASNPSASFLDRIEATIIGIAHFNKTGKTFMDLLKGGSQYFQVTRMILGVFKVDYTNSESPLVLTRAKCSPLSLDATSICYSLPKGDGTNKYLRPTHRCAG